MKKIKLSKPRGVLVHPNDSDLQFGVVRPPAADIIAFHDETKQYERQKIAVDPVTGEILRRRDGSPEYLRLDPIYPMKVITEFLGKYTEWVKGLQDENGKEIELKPSNREMVFKSLMEPDFIVVTMRPPNPLRCDRCGGIEVLHDPKTFLRIPHEFVPESTDQEVRTQCTQWLVEGICNDATYYPLEQETSSPMHANDGSEKQENSAETVTQ